MAVLGAGVIGIGDIGAVFKGAGRDQMARDDAPVGPERGRHEDEIAARHGLGPGVFGKFHVIADEKAAGEPAEGELAQVRAAGEMIGLIAGRQGELAVMADGLA